MRTLAAISAVGLVLFSAPLHGACTFGFLPASPYPANAHPGDATAADFNEDTFLDLAVLNRGNSTISILLGDGAGGFAAPTTIATSPTSGDLQAGDVNADTHVDLVVAVQNAPDVHSHLKVLLGNGDGTFTAVAYTDQQLVFQNPGVIALADFNRDGLLDAAVTKANGQWASLQNVGGRFTQKASYSASPGGVFGGIAAGDFDGDGKIDVAVSEWVSNEVDLFWGAGDGTFVAGATSIGAAHATWDPDSIAAGDFNGDGRDDLAIVMNDPYGSPNRPPLHIALSGANRAFAEPVAYGAIAFGNEVHVRDMDGDGKLDAIVATGSNVTVFRGNGDGTLAAQQTFGAALSVGMAIGDYDRDGGPDVAATAFTASAMHVLRNRCGRVTLTLHSSANPAPQGTSVTVTGTVVSPPSVAATGTLTLKRGATTLASGNLAAGGSVAATMSDLAPGTYTITAEYSGDARFAATSTTLEQIVDPPPFGPPPGVVAFSTGGPVQVSWVHTANAHHYEVWRNNGSGWTLATETTASPITDAAAPASSALLYRVRAVASDGTPSAFSAPDLTITYSFTDPTLQAGLTRVKLAHLTELRSAANAARARAGLDAVSWSEPSPSRIRASQITELRTAVAQARAALGLSTIAFTDATLTATVTPIRAIHFEELRASMR